MPTTRCVRLSRVLVPVAGLAVAVLLAVASLATPGTAKAEVRWLCHPRLQEDACGGSLTTTRFDAGGKRVGVERVARARRPEVDCFYVYPTVSDQPSPQATQVVDDVLRSIVRYQAVRYASECRIFAPVYRQVTIQGLTNPDTVTEEMREEGYRDVRDAFRRYLRKDNRGRGFVLLGHSQGTRVLRQLVAEEVDRRPSVRRRLVSAQLLGGNVLVKRGSDRGGDFRNVPACRRDEQLGCVVAFSTFSATPPDPSRFGRAEDERLEVLCTNPASLSGGEGTISTISPTAPFAPSTIGAVTNLATAGFPSASTPFVELVRGYHARCSGADGADVLRILERSRAPFLQASPDATWGNHLVDANIAQRELVELVHRQVRAYRRRR